MHSKGISLNANTNTTTMATVQKENKGEIVFKFFADMKQHKVQFENVLNSD